MTITEAMQLEERDKSLDDVWHFWLTSLNPWERHFIFKDELRLHDEFCAGEIGWADLSEMLHNAHKEDR